MDKERYINQINKIMKKKVLHLAIAVMMMLVPYQALAHANVCSHISQVTSEVTSFKDALAGANNGDEICLEADEAGNFVVTGKKITINLNGYTLSALKSGNPIATLTVGKGAEVTIKGATGTIAGYAGASYNNASINAVNGGKVTITEGNFTAGIYATNSSEVTINGGFFEIADFQASFGSEIYFNGGKFKIAPEDFWLPYGYTMVQGEDGYYILAPLPVCAKIGDSEYYYFDEAIWDATDGDVIEIVAPGTYAMPETLPGITIKNEVKNEAGEINPEAVKLTYRNTEVPSVTFLNNAVLEGVTIYTPQDAPYTRLLTSEQLIVKDCYVDKILCYGNISFSNCTFTSLEDVEVYIGSGEVSFSNCTKQSDVSLWAIDDWGDADQITVVEDGVQIYPTMAFQVGSELFATLSEAINAVEDGGIITLNQDVDNAEGILIDVDKSFTIDFCGYSYSVNTPLEAFGAPVAMAVAAGNITFASGTIDYSCAEGIMGLFANFGGTVTFFGMTTHCENNMALYYSICNLAGTMNIIDGNYDGRFYVYSGNVNIDGGKFTATAAESLEGLFYMKQFVKEEDGEWYVLEDLPIEAAVAKIEVGEEVKYYATLNSAIKAVGNGQTITLLKDILDSDDIKISYNPNDFTIDFDGHTYNHASSRNWDCWYIEYSGTVTLKNGTITTSENLTPYDLLNVYEGNLVLDNMTIDGSKALAYDASFDGYTVNFSHGTLDLLGATSVIEGEEGYAIYAYDGEVNCDITGTIKGILYTDEVEMNIYNGNFDGTLGSYEDEPSTTITGGKFSYDPSEYVQEGYAVEYDGSKWYTVIAPIPTAKIGETAYYSLDDAINATSEENGTTITLLRDVEDGEGFYVPYNKNITIDFDGHEYTVATPYYDGWTGVVIQGEATLMDGKISCCENADFTTLITLEGFATFDNMTIDGTNLNNSEYADDAIYIDGGAVFNGNTSIIARQTDYAIYEYNYRSVIWNSTGTVDGNVMSSGDFYIYDGTFNSCFDLTGGGNLRMFGGTFNGNSEYANIGYEYGNWCGYTFYYLYEENFDACGGKFKDDPTDVLKKGYQCNLADDYYIVSIDEDYCHIYETWEKGYTHRAVCENDWIKLRESDSTLGKLLDIEVSDDVENVGIEYVRDFKNTEYQGCILPYAFKVPTWLTYSYSFDKILSINDEEEENTITSVLQVAGNTIPANTPFLIKANYDEYVTERTINFDKVTLQKTDTSKPIVCEVGDEVYTFTGTYSKISGTEMTANNRYALQDGIFKKANGAGANLKPYRFYLEVTDKQTGEPVDALNVKIRHFDSEEDASSIRAINAESKAEGIFDIYGRKLDKVQGTGIYIINGEKVFIK